MTKGENDGRFCETMRVLHRQLDEKRNHSKFFDLFANYWIDLSPWTNADSDDSDGMDHFVLWAVRKTLGNAGNADAPTDVLWQGLIIAYHEVSQSDLEKTAASKVAIGLGSLLGLAHRYGHFVEGANINAA